MRGLIALLMLVLSMMASTASAVNYYTNDFSGTEPPDNWSISYTSRFTEMSSCTFTAGAGIGTMDMGVTTNTNAKIAYFNYPGGSAWTNYTFQFRLAETPTDTNNIFGFGLFYPGTGTSNQARYIWNPGTSKWRLILGASGIDLDSGLVAGDIIKLYKYGNDYRLFINEVQLLQTTSTTVNGTIYFSLQRTVLGTSTIKIDDITVNTITPPTLTVTPTPTFTYTSTPTVTHSPVVSPTATPIPWYPNPISKISLPGQPQAVCFYSGKVWVTINQNPGSVLQINPDTLVIEQVIDLGVPGSLPQSVYGMDASVYAGTIDGGNLAKIDINTFGVVLKEGGEGNFSSPNMMVSDGSYLYLACMERITGKDMVLVMNPDMSEVARWYLGSNGGTYRPEDWGGLPYGICYTGSKIVVGRFNTQDVVILDATTGDVLAYIKTPIITNSTCDIVYLDGYVWVTSWGDGVLWKINPDTFSCAAIPLNSDWAVPGYSWVIYGLTSDNSKYLFTTDYEAGRLHKVRISDGLDVGWTECALNPQGVAYGDGFVYVTDAARFELVKIQAGEDYPTPTVTPTITMTPTPGPSRMSVPRRAFLLDVLRRAMIFDNAERWFFYDNRRRKLSP